MKKLKVVNTTILLVIIFLTVCMPVITFATEINPDDYDPSKHPIDGYSEVTNITKNIVSVISSFGIVVAVVGIIIIGIKYITGSVEQRADYKKTMIPYLVGCVMIFGITQIISLIYKITTQVTA